MRAKPFLIRSTGQCKHLIEVKNKTAKFCACDVGMRGILILEKCQYLLCLKWYNIIILLISLFHTLLFRCSPVGGSASQIAVKPVNLTTELRDGSKQMKLY